MCDCASCEYTDSFSGWEWNEQAQKRVLVMRHGRGGFASWPRGDPTGPRKSAAEYAGHVAHLWEGVARRNVPFTPGQAPQYPAWTRGNGPIQPAPKWLLEWINRKEAGPVLAAQPSPTEPCKAPQHFPAPNRQRETSATIYEMGKEKAKRPVGRPPIMPGKEVRRVLVSLDDASIERASSLGGGNVSAGIRKALARRQSG